MCQIMWASQMRISKKDKELSDTLWNVIWRVRFALEDHIWIIEGQINRLEEKIDQLNKIIIKLDKGDRRGKEKRQRKS
jgi:hypothetical protein